VTSDNEVPDLDTLVEAARLAAAQRRSTEAAAAEVLHMLGTADGAMPLEELLARGVSRDLVAQLVADDPHDKRKRQRARLGFVGKHPVVWLTATGWQATGRASGREVVPTADSVTHAMAPAVLGRWVTARAGALAARGITVKVTYGAACRRWSAEVTARAWAALRTQGDTGGAIGSLTGGLIPDGIVVERLPQGEPGTSLHTALWGSAPVDDDDLAESSYAVEVEDSRKAGDPLRSKVDQLTVACEQLHAARAVLWVVRTREVANRLRDLGVDDPRRPSQLLVPGRDVGLGGEDVGLVRRPWYLTRVPADEG
jgi:hypothetical protein